MEAPAVDLETAPTSKEYTSRPGALIWCFRKSRDRWKRKHQELKATVKGYKNRVADLTKSRDRWRLKAEESAAQGAALEAEVAALRAEIARGGGGGKKTTAPGPR